MKGKTALVTGAARGIGKAIAAALADAGAAVVLCDLQPEVEQAADEIRRSGAATHYSIFDIADSAAVRQKTAEIKAAVGGIDILVNNASIVDNVATVAKMTPEAWTREISVNLNGAFFMAKECLDSMVEKKWGRIVNISSLAASGGLHSQAANAASKAGVIGLTKTLALEHAKDGIACNAILPGVIDTELVRRLPPSILDGFLAFNPSRRVGLVEEIAHLVVFLASDRAAYINGAEIPVDGGMHLNLHGFASQRNVLRALRARPGRD